MIPAIAHGLVLAGLLLLVLALFIVRRLVLVLNSSSTRAHWYAMTAMIVLFLVGYLGYLAAFWNSHDGALDLIVPGVFFLGGCFVRLAATLSLQTAVDLLRVGRLEREVFTDPLTGVFNRRYMDRRLREEVSSARRYGRPLAVLLLDVDHFKRVNDEHGHQVGDQVLIATAEAATAVLREPDVLARYGGEEFLVIAADTRPEGAAYLAERLRRQIEATDFRPKSESGGTLSIRITASVGVANFGGAIDSVDALVHAADEGLYRAKNEGRNRVVVASSAGGGAVRAAPDPAGAAAPQARL